MGMNPLLGYGLISSVGSLGSSLFNQFMGQSQSKDLMDYQYQLQQQAIDKANAYNHPAEQIKRLAEAQLNPNLVYGSGVDGNQSSPASPGMVNRSGQMQNPLQDLGQAYLQGEQLKLEKAKTESDILESRQRRVKIAAETLGQIYENDYANQTLKTRIQHASQKLANDVMRESVMAQQSNNLRMQAGIMQEQANNIAAKTNLTEEQALTEVVKRRGIETGIKLQKKQIQELTEMIKFIQAGTRLRNQQGDIQKTAHDATKIFQEWKAKHPKTTLTIEIVKEILGMGKDIAGIASGFVVP